MQFSLSIFGKSTFIVSTPVLAFLTTCTKSPSAGGGMFRAYSTGGFNALNASTTKMTGRHPSKVSQNEPVIKSVETMKQLKSPQDVKGKPSYIEVPSGFVGELDDENLSQIPSTHGTGICAWYEFWVWFSNGHIWITNRLREAVHLCKRPNGAQRQK